MLPADFRIHRHAAATLVWQPVDSEGELAVASGAPTVAVVDAQGVAVTVGAPTLSAGIVSLALTAAQTANVDRWTVTWSLDAAVRGVSTVDIVGGVYLTVAEIRALEPSLGEAEFPAAVLRRGRREVEARFERSVQGVAFVPRLSTFRVTPYLASTSVPLPHYFVSEIRSARYRTSGAWSTVDVTGAHVSESVAVLGSGSFASGYQTEINYVHGLTSPPEDVKRAAALAVRHQVLQNRSGIDSRAMSYQPSEGGNVILATAGVGPWEFGIPDVDGVLRSWRDRYPTALVA